MGQIGVSECRVDVETLVLRMLCGWFGWSEPSR